MEHNTVTDRHLRLVSWTDVYDSCIAKGWSHEAAAIAARNVTVSR